MSFIFYVTAEDITRLLRHKHPGGATANTSHLLLPSPQRSACLVQLRRDVVDWVKKESSMHNVANTPLWGLDFWSGHDTLRAKCLSRLLWIQLWTCLSFPKNPESIKKEVERDHGGNKLHARSRFVPVNARKSDKSAGLLSTWTENTFMGKCSRKQVSSSPAGWFDFKDRILDVW